MVLSDQQVWFADGYERNARFVSDLGAEVLAWLAPRPSERILDAGCGDGALTQRIAESGAIVTGVDLSASLLEAARRRGLDVVHADIVSLPFEAAFDAVFSNAVLHWIGESTKAAESIRRALKPGGRFVAEFGGHGNVAAIATALRAAARHFGGDESLAAPWFNPTTTAYRALLEASGFAVRRVELIPRPTPLPTGIEGWLDTFRKPFFAQFGDARGREVREWVIDILKRTLCDGDGQWTADYVRLRVAAIAV